MCSGHAYSNATAIHTLRAGAYTDTAIGASVTHGTFATGLVTHLATVASFSLAGAEARFHAFAVAADGRLITETTLATATVVAALLVPARWLTHAFALDAVILGS